MCNNSSIVVFMSLLFSVGSLVVFFFVWFVLFVCGI